MFRLLFLVLILGVFLRAQAQKPRDIADLSLSEIMAETQFSSDDSEDLNLVWWIPTEFWQASSVNDPTISQEDQDALKSLVDQYTIIAVVKGEIGLFGGVKFDDFETIRKKFKVLYKDQKYRDLQEYNSLKDAELEPDLINFFDMIRPMLSNMMGALGENFHLLVYQNHRNGALFNPYSDNQGVFELDDVKIEFQFPISSLIKRKLCPTDQALLKGTWNFCPVHGNPLEER